MTQRRKHQAWFASLVVLAAPVSAPAMAGAAATTESAREALFARYPATESYGGPNRLPDFRGRDRAFSDYRTRIREGARQGVNFAGHYAIIEWGCGTQCLSYVIEDVATGKMYNFSLGDGEYEQLSLDYRPTSRLIVAEWLSDADDSSSDKPVINCFRQNLVWNGSSAVPLSKPAVIATINSPRMEQCGNP